MYLVGRQDHVLARETTTWLERTDARVGVPIDGTARSLGQYASEVRLRSKQELPRRRRLLVGPQLQKVCNPSNRDKATKKLG